MHARVRARMPMSVRTSTRVTTPMRMSKREPTIARHIARVYTKVWAHVGASRIRRSRLTRSGKLLLRILVMAYWLWHISYGRARLPRSGKLLLRVHERVRGILDARVCFSSPPASPTACLLRGHGRAGTQNDRLGEVRRSL